MQNHEYEAFMSQIENAMGYVPDFNVIKNAIYQYKNTPTDKLRKTLNDNLQYFKALGGRSVQLAEEIDALTVALAVRDNE